MRNVECVAAPLDSFARRRTYDFCLSHFLNMPESRSGEDRAQKAEKERQYREYDSN